MILKQHASGKMIQNANGKLTCECCDSGCCMYRGSDFGSLYSADDLLTTVKVNGVSKSRSGTGYGNTTDGVILESGVWAVYKAGVRTEQDCLVGGIVEDELDACYQVNRYVKSTDTKYPVATAARQSRCYWQSVVPGCGEGSGVTVFYSEDDCKWHVVEETRPCGGYGNFGTKTGPDQSTPIGEYYDSGGSSDWEYMYVNACP